MNYRDSLCVKDNHLYIGGVDSVKLVEKYGTPLYVLDEKYIRDVCRSFVGAIKENYGEGCVAFASKAFCCKGIYSIIKSEGLSADVVSGGEIYTALQAGFDAKKMFFHGNNKLYSELELAVKSGVGIIVADNLSELEIIDGLAAREGICQNILLRVNPGVEAHTHSYVQTAKTDSKFGFGIWNGDAENAFIGVGNYKNICLKGFHCHIGSQIFEKQAFVEAADKMTDFARKMLDKYGFVTEILNLGGGFGITYTDEDPSFRLSDYTDYVVTLAKALKEFTEKKGLKKPVMVIEPGRAIVGEAGVTLYSVGAIKDIEGVRKYVSIDGGMGDNPRYALYQSKYSALLANRATEAPVEKVSVAGKCCESGDLIAVDIDLPEVRRGDILAVFATGAYNYSMSSNYNRNPVPPVVLVNDGKSDYLVKPQSYEDICRNDTLPDWISGK